MFLPRKIKHRLVLLITLFAFGLIGAVATSRTMLSRVSIGSEGYTEIVQSKDLVADILPPPMFVVETYLTVSQMDRAINDDAAKAVLTARLAKLSKEFEASFERWSKDLKDDAELGGPMLGEIGTSGRAFMEAVSAKFVPAIAAKDGAASSKVISETLQPLFERHRSFVEKTVGLATQRQARRETRAMATVRRSDQISIAVSLLALAVCTGISWFITSSVMRSIYGINGAIAKLAKGDGNLGHRLHGSKGDEFSLLARSLNEFVEMVERIVRKVQESTSTAAEESSQISKSSAEMVCRISENASRTREVSDSVEINADRVRGDAESSRTACEATRQATATAQSGNDIIKRTIAEIQTTMQEVERTKGSIGELGEQSQKIGSLVTSINDIADQTNLLALNAAIEAARAGEQGRGFAVVADEVRKLAERTTKATEEIAATIGFVQRTTQVALEQMSGCSTSVNRGAASIKEAGVSLQQIMDSAIGMTGTIGSIASSTTEQSDEIKSIMVRVREIAEVTGTTNTDAEHTAVSLDKLSVSMLELQQLVGKFKLNDYHAAAERLRATASIG